jgi:hypothetical protein
MNTWQHKKTSEIFFGLILILIFVVVVPLRAQSKNDFAERGTVELGGSISYENESFVGDMFNGSEGIFTLDPYFGFFPVDGLEIGFDPLEITILGSNVKIYNIFIAPSYNFETNGIIYPFVEGQIGYTAEVTSITLSGLSWGLRGGIKAAITGNGLLNIGIQYRQITENPDNSSGRNGYNQFSIEAGFTVWLN